MTLGRTTTTRDDWFGQPKGLTVLAATEMWEVFSFVGMKTLLVYYMTKDLKMAPDQASMIYGLYTGCAYFLPILGALLCDRWLGRRTSVILGGSIMALGHFMLVFEGLFYPALATVALGAGLYLPSLPSQIKDLYAETDARRKWAHNAYYVGMNVGALLAPLVCGTLGEFYGWHWGFGVAGVGMVIGVATYIWGGRHLPPEPLLAKRAVRDPRRMNRSYLIRRFSLILGIAFILILFRAANEQIGNSLALWLDEGVDRSFLGSLIPMTWFQSINPFLIFLLTPLFVMHWARLARRGHETPTMMKMAFGAVLLAASYGVLALAATASDKPSWIWFATFVAGLTAAELYVMPICLGLFNRIAPIGFAATGVAIWFLTGSGGNLLGGALGSLWTDFEPAHFFMLMMGVAGVAAVLLLLMDRPVRAVEGEFAPHTSSSLPPI